MNVGNHLAEGETMPQENRQTNESVSQPADVAGQAGEKNWGPPYKAIFVSQEKGFEMGENRQFKQRVFIFKEKPEPEVLAALKDNGFTYRPAEKAWTIQANAATRELADRLAQQFAGEAEQLSR
jgi:hypothetical protein